MCIWISSRVRLRDILHDRTGLKIVGIAEGEELRKALWNTTCEHERVP
jgi:hypothetical protein